MPSNAGQTVREILQRKQSSICFAPLSKGAPSWDDILDMMWEEVVASVSRREPGFEAIRKLLPNQRFDR